MMSSPCLSAGAARSPGRPLSRWVGAVSAGLALCGAPGASAQDAPPARRPNIIYVLTDDMGWNDVGYNGSEIRTPNIDRLAATGVKLDQFYVQPLCSPTRAALLTGRYPMRQGLQTLVIFPWADYGLPEDERTLPQALREAGYTTSLVGKWHLGHADAEYLPMARGFDHQYGFYNGAITYFNKDLYGGLDWHRDQQTLHEEGYATQLIGREAVRQIDRHDASKPLFMFVAFNAPHTPLQAPKEYIQRYGHIEDKRRRVYAAMVTCADDEIGKIHTALVNKGMIGNTLFIFSSDNGGVASGGGSNLPLKGGKGTYYEGGVRVPAFMSWPGTLPEGKVVTEPMHITDLYPTLLTLAGGGLQQSKPLDGQDVWPAIAHGQRSGRTEILHNLTPTGGSIRVGDWKLIVNSHYIDYDQGRLGWMRKHEEMPEEGLAAMVERTRTDKIELYNIAADPNEKRNLAESMPEKVSELRRRLDELAKQAVPPMNKPEPAGMTYPKEW